MNNMKSISSKGFEKLIERHKHYLKEDTDNWRSCKAIVCSKEVEDIVVINGILQHSHFEYVSFNGTTFINANFVNANFHSCQFNDCNFIKCDFGDAVFTDVAFKNCLFTSSKLRSCIFDDCSIFSSRHMSNDILEKFGIGEGIYVGLTPYDVDIFSSTFQNCTFQNAFAESTKFLNNLVLHSRFYECDFSLVDVYGKNNKYMTDRRTIFNNCNFQDYENKNIPDLPMACPEVGSFIAYKKVNVDCINYFDTNNIGSTAIVVLQVPASAKRMSANTKKCRCNKAKVLRFETLGGERIRDTEKYTFHSMHDPSFEYIVGKTVAPVSTFEEDRWKECSSGIHFFMNREDAVYY